MPKNTCLVVGARPNFMKAAPLMRQLQEHPDDLKPYIIHTGQHYDYELSQMFFEQLGMPHPDIYLGVGSGTHANQTARIMIGLEQEFVKRKPDLVVVFGDINSTLAASIVAAKLGISLCHVEAGLRSFDNSMPEEINRIVTDRLSDLLFVSERSGVVNLRNEGVLEEQIYFVGNIMIDSLLHTLPTVQSSDILSRLSHSAREYAVMTLHRPANVDDRKMLGSLLGAINEIGKKIPVVFPCHPRTKKNLEKYGLLDSFEPNVLELIGPLGYIDFLKLQCESRFVLTDSGGIQEETTFLNIPCITLRNNTERPITVEIGSNVLTGINPDLILEAADQIISGCAKQSKIPELWDGKTARRIVDTLLERL